MQEYAACWRCLPMQVAIFGIFSYVCKKLLQKNSGLVDK
jgi:hypothetical protein